MASPDHRAAPEARAGSAQEALALVDGLVEGPVLVFGSLGPAARDVDLLVRTADLASVRAGLAAAGFVNHGRVWARFDECRAEAVEVVPAESWRLPPGEEAQLFGLSVPAPGYRHVVRPGPEHELLIVATRVAELGRLDGKRKARVDAALASDPDAWWAAAGRATSWRAEAALESLRAQFDSADHRRSGGAKLAGAARSVRATLHRKGGAIIAFSGLDGAGKSSQASSLAEALNRVGYDTVVEWTAITANRSVEPMAQLAKRVLQRVITPGEPAAAGDHHRDDAGGRAIRERSRAVTFVWTTVLAVLNAGTHRRTTRAHLRRGRVVLCDRYVLDSMAHLRFKYGPDRRFPLQQWIIERISPRPLRAYFLDVDASVAIGRKQDEFSLDELDRTARLYREEYGRLGVSRLDGARPRAELCREIALDVWAALARSAV